ncbi:MAG: ribulokinase, partial [Mesorhizobium sp.]
MTKQFVCAVDVGTGSARAGILDTTGTLLGRAERPIAMNQPKPDHAEHDSRDIWSSVCTAVRAAREKAGVEPEDIVGISFDATCSLVVRDRQGGQHSVSTTGDKR